MTDDQKKAECARICGEAGKRGVHSIAPIVCPIELDNWHKPKRNQQ